MAEETKTRVLAWGDYGCTTGFGTVMSNIMRPLFATGKYELDVLGINYTGDPVDPNRWPGRLIPAVTAQEYMAGQHDVYGRQKLVNLIGAGDYDILFLLQDTFILQQGGKNSMINAIQETIGKLAKKPRIIYYYPLDFRPKPHWINEVLDKIDYGVPYTEYAKAESLRYEPKLRNDLTVIPHGTNLKDFHVLPPKDVEEWRKVYFGGYADGKFLLLNLNRNQVRKDIARSMMVIKELKDRGHKDIIMYIHAQNTDAGGTLSEVAFQLGLEINKDYMVPAPSVFAAHTGLPVSDINLIYNSADAVITTTLGEGWGLSITEGMATRTPIIAPNNTSLTEMLGASEPHVATVGSRGWLGASGNNTSMWVMHGPQDNELLRPLADVSSMADQVEAVMEGKYREQRVDAAFAWAQDLSWENIVERHWLPLFEKATAAVTPAPVLNRAQRRKLERLEKHKGR